MSANNKLLWDKLFSDSLLAVQNRQFDHAVDLALQAAQIATTLGTDSDSCFVQSLLLAGEADLQDTPNLSRAGNSLQRAMGTAASSPQVSEKDKASVMFWLSEVYSKTGRRHECNQLLESALPLAKRALGERADLPAKILYSYGLNLGIGRDFANSLGNMQLAAEIFRELGKTESLIMVLADIANILEFAGRHNEAIPYRNHVDELCRWLGAQRGYQNASEQSAQAEQEQRTQAEREDLAAEVLERLVRMGHSEDSIRLDRLRYGLQILDPRGNVKTDIALEDLFKRYVTADDAERVQILDQFETGFLVSHKRTRIDLRQVLPDLRARWDLEEIRLRAELGLSPLAPDGAPESIPCLIVAEHFAVTFVADMPEHKLLLTSRLLDEAGLDIASVDTAALNNLRERSKTGTDFVTHTAEKSKVPFCHQSNWHDTYDAARITLIDEWLHQIPVKNRLLLAVPDCNTFLAADETPMGLAKILTVIRDTLNNPKSMPPFVIQYVGGKYLPWEIPADHPFYEMFHSFQTAYLSGLYAAQKQLLDGSYAALTGSLLVAPAVSVHQDKSMRSKTTVIKEKNMLVPVCDRIEFSDGGQIVASASWTSAMEQVGHLFEATHYYPQLLKVTNFPTPAELSSL